MNFTNIKQSERLYELGLPRESASMCYRLVSDLETYGVMPTLDRPYIDELPCWMLEDLYNVLPVGDYNLTKNALSMYGFTSNVYTTPTLYNTPIEAMFTTVEWMLEHKLIESKKEKNNG